MKFPFECFAMEGEIDVDRLAPHVAAHMNHWNSRGIFARIFGPWRRPICPAEDQLNTLVRLLGFIDDAKDRMLESMKEGA